MKIIAIYLSLLVTALYGLTADAAETQLKNLSAVWGKASHHVMRKLNKDDITVGYAGADIAARPSLLQAQVIAA